MKENFMIYKGEEEKKEGDQKFKVYEIKVPKKNHSFLELNDCNFVLVDSPGIEVLNCDKMLTQYIQKRNVAPYGILLVDFTKAIAGGERNLQILSFLKDQFEGELDLAVVFTKQPKERATRLSTSLGELGMDYSQDERE